jgi:hypothetical protein
VQLGLVGRAHAARVAAVLGELLEVVDAVLSGDPGRVAVRQGRDQALYAVADLQREVGGCRADQRPDVLGSRPLAEALGKLRLAHGC